MFNEVSIEHLLLFPEAKRVGEDWGAIWIVLALQEDNVIF